jgi:hypothetical protein
MRNTSPTRPANVAMSIDSSTTNLTVKFGSGNPRRITVTSPAWRVKAGARARVRWLSAPARGILGRHTRSRCLPAELSHQLQDALGPSYVLERRPDAADVLARLLGRLERTSVGR